MSSSLHQSGGMENLDELLASLEEESSRKSNSSVMRGSNARGSAASSASGYDHLFAGDPAPRASQANKAGSRVPSSTIDFDIDQYLKELGQGGARGSTASVSSFTNRSGRSTQELSIDDINDLLEDKPSKGSAVAKLAPAPSVPQAKARPPSIRGSQMNMDELDMLLDEAEGRSAKPPAARGAPAPVSVPKAAPKAAASPQMAAKPAAKPMPRESVNFDEIDALLEDATSSRASSARVPPAAYSGGSPAPAMDRPRANSSISMDEIDALLDDQMSAPSSRREIASQQMSMDDIDALLSGQAAVPSAASPAAVPKAAAKPRPAVKQGVRPSQQMNMNEIADLLEKQQPNSELNRANLMDAFGTGAARPKLPAPQDIDELLDSRPAPRPKIPAAPGVRAAQTSQQRSSNDPARMSEAVTKEELDNVFSAAGIKPNGKLLPEGRPEVGKATMIGPDLSAASYPSVPKPGAGPQQRAAAAAPSQPSRPLTNEEIQEKAEREMQPGETVEQAYMRIKFEEAKKREEELILRVEAAERAARAKKRAEQEKFEARLTEAKGGSQRASSRESLLPAEPQLYTNTARDLEEKARREAEEEKRRQAREEAKFKEHMERRKLAMVDSILAEAGGTPLMDSGALKKSYFAWNINMRDVLVKERLGVGESGATNRGFYKDQAVIVKKLRSPPLTEPWLDGVREEVKILSMLMHPNLSLFLGIAVNGNDLYSITEHVPGLPLYGFLRNKAVSDDLDNMMILKWAKQIVNGMSYLHANKVIHRALKTRNILVDRENNLKIRDFGLHAVRDYVDSVEAVSQTPEYCAPELLARQPFDDRIDVYSFGIVLLEMYSKEPVYGPMPPEEIADGVLTAGLRPQIPADTPFVFIKLIESCWQTDPNLRPAFEKTIRILSQPPEKLFAYAAPK